MADEWHEAAEHIRTAVDLLEQWFSENKDDGSTRWAALWLARAQLLDGYGNIMTGEASVDDIRWARDRARRIVHEKGRDTGGPR